MSKSMERSRLGIRRNDRIRNTVIREETGARDITKVGSEKTENGQCANKNGER